MNKLGTRIREIRKAKGLTQQDLERRANFSSVYLSKIERGHVNPTARTLQRLAQALDVDVSDFLLTTELPAGNWTAGGEMLRARREQLGLAAPALAGQAGVGEAHLALIEGGHAVAEEVLRRLCAALRLDFEMVVHPAPSGAPPDAEPLRTELAQVQETLERLDRPDLPAARLGDSPGTDQSVAFRHNLARYRRLRGLTEAEVAAALGMDAEAYRRFEANQRSLNVREYAALLTYLDTHRLTDLFLEDEALVIHRYRQLTQAQQDSVHALLDSLLSEAPPQARRRNGE